MSSTTTSAAVYRANPARSLELALAAAQTAADNRGHNIVVLDMTGHTALFDYFVIATGTSRRQLHAMSEEIDHKLEDDLGDKRMNIAGYDESKWIVLDYGTVVIHLFDEDTRSFYSLENLWADSTRVDLTGVVSDEAIKHDDEATNAQQAAGGVAGKVTSAEDAMTDASPENGQALSEEE